MTDKVIAQPDNERDPYSDFQLDLERLINRYSLENRTDTPDFILAEFVVESLRALEHHHHAKRAWLSPEMQKPQGSPK
jgi:hypothetical protein